MILAQPRPTVAIVRFQPESPRTAALFASLQRAAAGAGIDAYVTDRYDGSADWLMLWGPGAPNRFGLMRDQVARGGHVLAWDLAYWQRTEKFRISIDGAHPPAWVMKHDWPVERLAADRVVVEHAWDQTGPVIVAGIGEKATVQYGADVVRIWELEQIRQARARGYRVLYRPKKSASPPAGVDQAPTGCIDPVLRGAAGVVTWHSNVAVDAIRLGLPVICKDGAASAVCPSTWPVWPTYPDYLTPLADAVRARFLANLAWFQWAPTEAAACWAFVREALA